MNRTRARSWIACTVGMLLAIVIARPTGADELTADVTRVTTLLDEGRYEEAELVARAGLAGAELTSGANSLIAAWWLDRLAESLGANRSGASPEAIAIAAKAVARNELVYGPSSPELVPSLVVYAQALDRESMLGEAESVLGHALDLLKRAGAASDLAAAAVHHNLGVVFKAQGRWDESRQELLAALAIHSDRDVAGGADGYEAFRLPDDATTAGEPIGEPVGTSGRTRLSVPANRLSARVLNSLGDLEREAGALTEARDLYAQILSYRRRQLGEHHLDVAAAWTNVGVVAKDLGLNDEGKTACEHALAIYRESGDAPSRDLAIALFDYGVLLDEDPSDPRAVAFVERGTVMSRELSGDRSADYAGCLGTLGTVYAERGDFDKAAPVFATAIALWTELRGPNHIEVAIALSNKAVLDYNRGMFAEAVEAFDKAYRIAKNALGVPHGFTIEILRGLAASHLAMGEIDLAIDDSVGLQCLWADRVRTLALDLTSTQSLSLVSNVVNGNDVLLSALVRKSRPESNATAFDALIRIRTPVLDAVSRRHRAVIASSDPETRKLHERWTRDRSALAAAFAKLGPSGGPRADPSVLPLAVAVERDEAELVKVSREDARRLLVESAGLDAVRGALPEGTALVSYFKFEDMGAAPDSGGSAGGDLFRYAAFVVSAGHDSVQFVPLAAAAKIDRLVAAWRKAISVKPPDVLVAAKQAEQQYRLLASRLRRAIWDPIAGATNGASRIFIVPDGSLQLLNFATLPREGGGYLVETKAPFHLLSAERDVVAASSRAGATASLLVLGGPDYNGDSQAQPAEAAGGSSRSSPFATFRGATVTCDALARRTWRDLPGARQEAIDIASLWSRTASRDTEQVLLGPDASEEAFKRLAPKYTVVHLATHGFVLDESCAPRESSVEFDLLRSGVILAGANRAATSHGSDDGVLTAEEVAAIDLSNVSWVVLSACDTALGSIRAGEGVFGLRRAFQIAGAGTLVMSLWKVRDVDARFWMDALYDARLSGADTPSALRSASMAALTKRRRAGGDTHPFWWGGFVAAGSWR
jgi:CHAT domain-containing protein/tetratricopeptide (TPR) repeat protein